MSIDKLIEKVFDDSEKELEDARFEYFSKYSDSQLDEIYEQDVNAREVVDMIRRARKGCY
ncbi:MAG: hypothetical protein WC906_04545 [Parcubacteria group bacterium]|jgi:hypothetical protein